MDDYHISVLLKEAIESLKINEGIYVDATMGGGGHSKEIFKNLKQGKLISIDQDQDAIDHVKQTHEMNADGKEWKVVKGNFRDLKKLLNNVGVNEIDGILYDIGVSSYQLDTKERGFAYNQPSPLDMRMDQSSKLTAEDVINEYSQSDLNRIFKEGDEKHAKKLTNKIVEYREKKRIKNSNELINIINECFGSKGERERVSKRVFQALRVEVNKELSALSLSLAQAFEILKKNGRCSVITFQPLERNVVESFIQSRNDVTLIAIATAGAIELVNNIRSKSAKMYILEKL